MTDEQQARRVTSPAAAGRETTPQRAASEVSARADDEPARADDEPARADDEPARADDEPPRADDEPARADDEPPRAGDEPADARVPAFQRFEFACPLCGRQLESFADYCPHCNAHLPFGGTFSPGKSTLAKTLSWVLLVVFVGSMATLLAVIAVRMIHAAAG